jgi:hypothetical protein
MLTTPCLAMTLPYHPIVAGLILPTLFVGRATAAVVLHLSYAILSMYRGRCEEQQWCQPKTRVDQPHFKVSMRCESVSNAPGRCKLQAQGQAFATL